MEIPVTQLFVPQLVQNDNKELNKYFHIQVETTGKWWIPLIKCLRCGKRVRVKTSSYFLVKADALALHKQIVRMQNTGYIAHDNVPLIYFPRY